MRAGGANAKSRSSRDFAFALRFLPVALARGIAARMRYLLVLAVFACSVERPPPALPAVTKLAGAPPVTGPSAAAPLQALSVTESTSASAPVAGQTIGPTTHAAGARPLAADGAAIAPSPGSPVEGPPAASSRVVDRVGPYARLLLPVRGLGRLSEVDRKTVRHLADAAAATETVAWDQASASSLDLHRLVVALARSQAVEPPVRERLELYLAAFELSLGPYDARSGAKLPLGLTRSELDLALAKARSTETSLPSAVPEAVARLWFEPQFQPFRSAAAAAGADPFGAIGVNFYDGVRVADLVGFEEKHPRNARLVKRDGKLVEELWRAGRAAADGVRPAPRGRMAEALGAAVGAIRTAQLTAHAPLARYLDSVIEALETGEPDAIVQSDDAWLLQEPPIAASFGFIETDWDPRARKGVWQALVVIDDVELRTLFQMIADRLDAIEARAPWKEAYRRTSPLPAMPWPVEAVAGSGATGPILPAEIVLPNESIGREVEPKTWLLANVVRAVDSAMDELTLDAFAGSADRSDARRYRAVITDLQIALDWLVGRPPCRPSPTLAGKDPALALKELATPLEFLKRSLVGLHFLADPDVRAAAPECGGACVEAAYRRLVRHETILLGQTHTARIEDEHHRALRLVVAWLSDRGAVRVDYPAAGDAVSPIQYTVNIQLAQDGVKELLGETVRIVSEGDYAAARTLFAFSELPDEEVMAPLRARVDSLQIPEAYGFVCMSPSEISPP
jgi:dipeptidyl-peptidase-3